MQKHERQKRILELIGTEEIHSQAELTVRLDSLGISATQASVSRDLDELNVVKVHGAYALPRIEGPGSQLGPVAFQRVGENLIVGKCSSGLASAITVRIDSAAIPEVAGTIAGDDTIFIAVHDAEGQKRALKMITEVFQ
jgi:transcriptional regulator of arginine metabolism